MMNLKNDPQKSRTGRADLIRCWSLGADSLQGAAALLGYERIEQEPERQQSKPQDIPTKIEGAAPVKTEESTGKKEALRFWQAVRYHRKDSDQVEYETPAWYTEAPDLQWKAPENPQPQRHKTPLTPWSRVWPLLRQELGADVSIGRLDVPKAVEVLARGGYLDPVPEERRRFWSARCQILVDFHPRLASFRNDFRRLVFELIHLRGLEGLELFYFENGPLGLCQNLLKPGTPPQTYVPGPADMTRLVLSDLGCLAIDEGRRNSWLHFGRALKRRGKKILALAPCPPRLWQPDLTPYWQPVFWDRGSKMKVARPPVGEPRKEDLQKGVSCLLNMLAPAVRIEPELLRDVRRLLPQKDVDVAVEAAILQHHHTRETLLGFDFHPNYVANYRAGFESLEPCLKKAVLEFIERWHESFPEGIREEERLLAEELTGKRGRDSQFLGSIIKAVEARGSYASGARAWFKRLEARQHSAMWKRPELVAAYFRIKRSEGQGLENVVLLEGMDPGQAAWVRNPSKSPEFWSLWQMGPEFQFLPGRVSKSDVGSFLVGLQSKIRAAWTEGPEPRFIDLKQEEPVVLKNPGSETLVIHSDMETWHFQSLQKPDWAQSMGRDDWGLSLEYQTEKGLEKAYWLSPGILPVEGLSEGLNLKTGAWLCEAQYDVLKKRLKKPQWCEHLGLDQYGIFADLKVKGCEQRMRWIPPGQFLMGSPNEEEERRNDETLHEVILTRSFWLAETTCTQALWQQIMGDNPSHFKGEDLPVENVSWNDVNSFLSKLNERKPGLGLCLPTEAQWEYACRAGRQTPFWFGDNITTDQVNYHGNEPYNDGEKGIYRAKTLAVKAMVPNGWGLYLMHGNVWEWCADWYGDYPSTQAVDPKGPETGRYRVLRGGSWVSNGRSVRSAYRYLFEPEYRRFSTGFRLALGQELP